MMKFACFERTVELLYKYVVPKPRNECTKPEQLVVTFVAGYIGEYQKAFGPTSLNFCPTCVARLDSCIFPVQCSWCVLRRGVPPCRLCGVGAEQGEGKHSRPGPQETGSQRSV